MIYIINPHVRTLNEDPIIQIKNLRKKYGKVDAVSGITFNVESGKLFAFLGPNGAGKSTTIDMICTLLEPDEGKIIIDGMVRGKDDDAIRNRIGIVFQNSVLDNLLTVRENLIVRADLYGLKNEDLERALNDAAEATDILEFLDRPYGKLSGGQKRRADIARALVNTPKILFLDELTTGLDPQTKNIVWNKIMDLQKKTGMTVFLTTHYMEEAASADYIVVINHGEIAAQGTPYELQENYSSDRIKLTANDIDLLKTALERNHISYTVKENTFTIAIGSTLDAIPIVNSVKHLILGFEVLHGTMEDAFINIIGKEVSF